MAGSCATAEDVWGDCPSAVSTGNTPVQTDTNPPQGEYSRAPCRATVGAFMAKKKPVEKIQKRFGIGEWYGKPLISMSRIERKKLAEMQAMKKSERQDMICPFRSQGEVEVFCRKAGGVCSIRLYSLNTETEEVAVDKKDGTLRATCPYRFDENSEIYKWVSKVILGSEEFTMLKEIDFLERVAVDLSDEAIKEESEEDEEEGVGRIDKVLVVPEVEPLKWCALEVQAVYFSGSEMGADFRHIATHTGDEWPFPAGKRHPDYRSSGPKRLMPQLQIKVPSLRRWGKKMAVVIDEDFFKAMGPMDTVKDVSNCDVAWFVVKFQERNGVAKLVPAYYKLTTLERSVEGLTAGVPVAMSKFEDRMRSKL